jgi:hypothetical protein
MRKKSGNACNERFACPEIHQYVSMLHNSLQIFRIGSEIAQCTSGSGSVVKSDRLALAEKGGAINAH